MGTSRARVGVAIHLSEEKREDRTGLHFVFHSNFLGGIFFSSPFRFLLEIVKKCIFIACKKVKKKLPDIFRGK